jgi:hypothetical protein
MEKKKIIFLLCLCMMILVGSADAVMSYLDNGTVKVGIDTNRGATINYLSASGSTRNVINYADLGREVQQSYYSGPVPFMGGSWNGSDWCWNPVAAGDAYNNRSTVLTYTNDGTTIYTKIIPKQWALNNVDSECTMETWITLSSNVVHVQCQLVVDRADTTWYGETHQELPAVYTTADIYRQFAYTGSSPFTSGGLTQINNSGPPWVYINATENWIANVDGTDWGLGVYNPKAQYTVMGFYGTHDTSPPGNPSSSSTGYIAPIVSEILDHNITYRYDFYLILGSLTNIRSYVYSHQPDKLPNYVFEEDRQGWSYKSGLYDTGFPINGYVRVLTVSSDPYMLGPETLWQASAAPRVYVRARYNTTNTSAKFYWSKFSSPGFTDANSKSFTIISDGQFHTYEVDLSSDSDYSGAIKQLRFDPVSSGGSGQYVDIASITSYIPTELPVIAEVSPDPDTNAYPGVEYIKQLRLTQGDAPITWSVVQGPAGIQVDSSGFVNNWMPGGCDVGDSITIGIRAENMYDSDTETWQVQPQAYYMTDNIANLSDLMVMADEWLVSGSSLTTDMDCSGSIDLRDFAELAEVWLEAQGVVITNLSPSSYRVSYDDLNIGELLYVDSTVTYDLVPPAARNKTYIKTANEDKDGVPNNTISFDVNVPVNVYVAHDDRITTKPSWLTSNFTDTGYDFSDDSADNVTLSIYHRAYPAGAVNLYENGGTQPNCSMYTVLIIEQ